MPTTVIPFPTLSGRRQLPNAYAWYRTANRLDMVSPLTNFTQSLAVPGAQWEVSMTFVELAESDAAIMRAWLASLEGGANWFSLYPLHRSQPRGAFSGGTPLAAAAAAGARTLAFNGCPASRTGYLLADDYFALNGELHQVAAAVNTTAGGVASIPITAPTRRAVPAGAAPVYIKPTTTFRLTTPRIGGPVRPRGGGLTADFAIDAIEAWDA